jgi:hypothetical protein
MSTGPTRSWLWHEWEAARLYQQDVKLHLSLDQAERGFFTNPETWNIGLDNPLSKLNFCQLWDQLTPSMQEFYKNLARRSLNENSEIKDR